MKVLASVAALMIATICFSGCNHHDKNLAVFNVTPIHTNTIVVECNCYCPEHPEAKTHTAHPEHPINPNHPVHPH